MERFLGLLLISSFSLATGCLPQGVESASSANLKIRPLAKTLAVNNSFAFSYLGGAAPVTFAVLSGDGAIDAATGVYTAPSSAGSAVIRVTDVNGDIADSNVTIMGAVALTPATQTVAANSSFAFTASNGVPPYSFSIANGGGSVSASGVYTAPADPGTAEVWVTDSLGNTASANLTINPALAISPTTQTMLVSTTHTFSATGGVGARTFSVASGAGTIHATTGLFSAAASAGAVTVRVTDSLGNIAQANVTVNAAVSISPSSSVLVVDGTATFAGVGGVPPYAFSLFAGTGSVDSTTGVYTAPSSAGSATVRVTDSLGGTANASVTVNPSLTISPSSRSLAVNQTFTFSGTGGVPPYSFAKVSGTGTISASTGLYTAPATPGTAIVRVTDSTGANSVASITVSVPVAISPSSRTLAVGGSQTFTASNGAPPYAFSILSGAGSVNASTGVFTAGSAGTTTVRVTDSGGGTSDATVTVNPVVSIAPASKILAVNNQFSFTAMNGVPPYAYSVFSGGGNIHPTTGMYTAPASSGSANVRVTDSTGATANSTITINSALAISPISRTMIANDSTSFSATGGVLPYTYSVFFGSGSINSATGSYTAPPGPDSVTVRVTDAVGNTSDSLVTVTPDLVISPTSSTLAVTNTQTFTAGGGTPPYSYSVVSGGGSVNASGLYTAGASAGSATVRVTDAVGDTAQATITINAALALSPLSVYMGIGNQRTFTGSGGVPPYAFSVISGGGSIDSFGVFNAPSSAGTSTVRVTDSYGNFVNTTIRYHFMLSANDEHTCAIITGNVLKCWGNGASGRLGLGDVNSRGDGAGEMGASLPAVNLGTGRKALSVSAGPTHTCAILDGGSVKCWGLNTYGQLGTGSTTTLGDGAGEMGDALPDVPLGTGRTAKAIGAGLSHTCALLDNGTIKCWGRSDLGQLGYGNLTSLGDGPGEMGDSLAAVALGTGSTARELAVGRNHTCALLDDYTVKCWGRGTSGQIGFGSTAARGDGASEMGDSNPGVPLGTGRSARGLRAGQDHTCAVLDDSSLKCWGLNAFGELGQGNVTARGDNANELGDNLAAVALGTGRSARFADSGTEFTCAILDNFGIKCFGRSNFGQLGYGNLNSLGDGGGEMGDTLALVNLGSGRTVLTFAPGGSHSCAVLDNDAIKCWGRSNFGQLGYGNTNSLGDGPGEMGDSLSAVSLE